MARRCCCSCPLVYVLLAVFDVQRASYGVSGAARAAARAYSLAPDEALGAGPGPSGGAVALRDQRIDADEVELHVRCRPTPGNCLAPGSVIRSTSPPGAAAAGAERARRRRPVVPGRGEPHRRLRHLPGGP